MKKLNRKALRLAQAARTLTLLLLIAGVVMESYVVIGIAVVGEIAAMIYFRKYSRCPHCGSYIPHISPVGYDAGYCHRCNEKMDFDK